MGKTILLFKLLVHLNGLIGFSMKVLLNLGNFINLYRNTLMKPWKVNNKVAGYMKRVGKLELRTLNNAGHLVPMDQGENALAMAN